MDIFLHLCILHGIWTASGVTLVGLPATVRLQENSPAGTAVFCFQVNLRTGTNIVPGFPQILNSNPLTEDFSVSMLNSTHAQVSVTGSPNLDFESPSNLFVFQILVLDTDQNSDLQTLTVFLTDVDEPPTFLDDTTFIYVEEKSPPREIYQPVVYDPETRPLTFSLIPPDPAFIIDSANGFLSSIKPLDYLTDPRSYSFNISVHDGNNTSLKPIFIGIINLNDDKPQFLNTKTSFTIPEELSPGHIVANLTAVVPEDSFYAGFIFYTINANNYFVIQQYTGLVTVAYRMDRDSSPLRESPIITLTVSASFRPPGPPLTNTISLTISVTDINDHAPICVPDNQRREVPETEVKGALIATVTCTDNDVEPSFRQHVFTGLSCIGCNQLFTLRSNQIILNESLDFEDPRNLYENNEYSLLITAVDTNDTSLRGDAFVYVTVTPVNEFTPMFQPSIYIFTISELFGSGAVIGSVNATDRDLPPTTLLYSIVSGGETGTLRRIFHLDPLLGHITLLTNPDYEDRQMHTLVVRVEDGDPVRPRSSTTTVTIHITEANDEPPLCWPNKTNLMLPVDLRVGSNVQGFTLYCTDKDSPPTSFIYTILGSTNVNNHFGFSPSSGSNVTRLILMEPFDYRNGLDTVWRYSLTVLISDANVRTVQQDTRNSIQTGTIIINIHVVDPDLTTVMTTTTPRITYISIERNTFDVEDWYVWFIVTLCALLLLGMLGYLLYICGKSLSTKDCSCCESKPDHDQEQLIQDKAPPKREILMEVTQINTVFDGEEVDPVTQRVYEYNSKSGARRWKDAVIVSEPPLNQPESSTLVISRRPANAKAHPNSERPISRDGSGTADQSHGSPKTQSSSSRLSDMSRYSDGMSDTVTPRLHKTRAPVTAREMSEV